MTAEPSERSEFLIRDAELLRCGPLSARHTVVAGKAVVENAELQLPKLDEMLKRHDEISHGWQGEYV
jgi:hypothetical protein